MVPLSCLSGAASSAKPRSQCLGFNPHMHLMPAKGQNSFTSPTPSNPTHPWWSAVYSLMDLCSDEMGLSHMTPFCLQAAVIPLGPGLNQAVDKIPVCDPETCWHYEWQNTEQNKAKQNTALLRPGYCCHFPIPNNASLESGNISALKQLTLLLPPIEEDTSCVVGLSEDKDELLITWLLTFWSPTPPTREGSVGAQMVLPGSPAQNPASPEHPPGPRLLRRHHLYQKNHIWEAYGEGEGGVKPGYLYPLSSHCRGSFSKQVSPIC